MSDPGDDASTDANNDATSDGDLSAENQALLIQIDNLMAEGLETETEPFPETDREFDALRNEVGRIDALDLVQKLVKSGFVNHPWGPEKACCRNCMYYLAHRRWCDLPELALPVRGQWWCRLWRI